MASEITDAGAVEEMCSQAALTPDSVLRLRSVVRNDQKERDILEGRLSALDGEGLPPEERGVRQAAFAWILYRFHEAERALGKLDAGGMRLLIQGGIAMDRADHTSAIEALETAVAHVPESPALKIELACALDGCGRMDMPPKRRLSHPPANRSMRPCLAFKMKSPPGHCCPPSSWDCCRPVARLDE